MKSDMITESYKKRGVNRDRFKSVVTPYDSYLDVGCGSGVYLINNNYAIVEGCDIEDLRVDEARKTEFKIQNLPKLEYSDSQFDVVSVFEVLEHVQDYQLSIAELTRITKKSGEFSCYVYSKKALPRELIDDYFRIETKKLSHEQLWEMSEQLQRHGV